MEFYNFYEALPTANHMVMKANKKINLFENEFYSKLGLAVVEKISSRAEQGIRYVSICLNLDYDELNIPNINIRKTKKAWRYYTLFGAKYNNNKHYEKLNHQEKAVYKVLIDLTNKGYFVTLSSKKEVEGDGLRYEYTYHLPYMNIIW